MTTEYVQLNHPSSATTRLTIASEESNAGEVVQSKHPLSTTAPLAISSDDINADEDDKSSPQPRQTAYGQAGSKRPCDWIDLLTLTCTFACLIIGIVVVTPSLPYAWRLGFNKQIIVVGLMLTLMNLCGKRITTRFFVIIEARWGSSTLQNFDAIVRQSIFVPQTSIHWLLILLLLTTLPIGLSVAYKSFTGGSATQPAPDFAMEQYGVFSRPYPTTQKVTANPAKDAILSFMNAAADDEVGPTYKTAPQPFGYNQLLIDNGTAAVLDMPNATILATMQERLELGETLTITADVQGTVAVYNTSTPELLKDNNLWSYFYELDSFETYKTYRLGVSWSRYDLDAFIWLGGYYETCGVLPAYTVCGYWFEHYDSVDDIDVQAFRASNMTLLMNIYRQPCTATWNVSASTVTLLSGSCTDIRVPNRFQNMDGNMMPYIGDEMDIFQTVIYDFVPERPDSPWRLPSYAMLAATAYWARWSVYGLARVVAGQNPPFTQDLVYNVTNSRISSTRLTLAAHPGLYIVLAIQPVLTTVLLLLSMCFYSTPVDSGFGLTSILASISTDSLHYLRGAGLSGRLKRRLHLNIGLRGLPDTEQNRVEAMVESRVGLSKEPRWGKLQSGKVYG